MNQRNANAFNQGGVSRTLRNWIILIAILVIIAAVFVVISNIGTSKGPTETRLACYSNQSVTPFGKNIVYYDGASIHCLTSGGAVRWSLTVGEGARFSVGESGMVVWLNTQMYVLDESGRTTYQDSLGETVQFARVGKKYVAAVIGPDTSPTLVVRDLQGTQVDQEKDAFANSLLLNVGFYGDQGQYLWTTVLDVYGTVANTTLKTFEVGKKNTGESVLGEAQAYRILFENNRLRVITTRQMRTYNYQGIESANDAMLVYGWRLIDAQVPQKGDGMMLFAPTAQTGSQFNISELRILYGSIDRRFTLPSSCVGAVVYNRTIYAFSSQYIYRAGVNAQRFDPLEFPIKDKAITSLLGTLEDGRVLVACGSDVYVVTLPNT